MFKRICLALSLVAVLFAGKAYTQNTIMDQISPSANQLSPVMREAYIKQISRELYSSHLYLTYASYFADLGLDGCEKFFRHSSDEEREHAILFYNLLIDRGEKVQLPQVDASAELPTSVLDAFMKLMENEIQVTKSIHNLYTLALNENDYASLAFLHSFLLLQVEEEKQAQDLLMLLSQGPDDPAFIISFDEKVGEIEG